MKWALALVGLAACAKAPEPPVESPLRVSDDNGHIRIDAPGYAMVFGNNSIVAAQIPMPERLEIGSQQVLGDSIMCSTEAAVGLALFPGLSITAAPDHLGSEGRIESATITQTQNMNGPAAVEFVVNYDASIRSGPPPGRETFTGSSTFTFFATGRIIRRDLFEPFQQMPALTPQMPFGCVGAPFSNAFFLTSYWAFAPADAQVVRGDGLPAQANDRAACTIYPSTGAGIAVAWPAGSMTRYNPGDTASHVMDLIPGSSPEIPNQFYNARSAVQIGSGIESVEGCQELLADLVDNLPLFVNGNIDLTIDESGAYSDDTNREGQTVTLTSNNEILPRGVSLLLNVGESSHAIVTRDPAASDPPAFIQRLDATHVLFVFQDAIERDTTITIELF